VLRASGTDRDVARAGERPSAWAGRAVRGARAVDDVVPSGDPRSRVRGGARAIDVTSKAVCA